MKMALIALSIVAAGALLHLLFLWMERRGWIYYTHDRPSRSALGNAFLEVQAILEPDKKHLVEIKKEEKRECAESGDGKKNEKEA